MVLTKLSVPHILYASQKGTAQSIAQSIHQDFLLKGFKCDLSCLSNISDPVKLRCFPCTIFVVSTTGDGDPPDTALKFIRKLKANLAEGKRIDGLHYTLLGLGDTNYTNFCNFGKTLDSALQGYGGKRFFNCGWADDGTGLEIVVEPWIEGLFSALESFFQKNIYLGSLLHSSETESSTEDISSNLTPPEKMAPNFDSKIDRIDLLSTLSDSDCIKEEEQACHPVMQCSFPEDAKLSLSPLSKSFLHVNVKEDLPYKDSTKFTPKLPSSASDLISCRLTSCKILTSKSSVKKALEISLELPLDVNYEYEPGDSFGILSRNPDEEVDLLLKILGIEHLADCSCEISIDPTSKRKTDAIPSHLPPLSSLRYIFTYCLEIRSIPKKPFLRSLVEFTNDLTEKRRLQELVCREGSQEYLKYVREEGLTFIDLLIFFKSCTPPLNIILQHLPPLLPRPYSITSSPLENGRTISFVFNVVEIRKKASITFSRKGICTGWLDKITKEFQNHSSIDEAFQAMSLEENDLKAGIQIYFRTNTTFRLPRELSIPIVMVGPGTGVAPFIGFLRHRHLQLSMENSENDFFISWLFFGCRKRSEDFLYEKEINSLEELGIIKNLHVCFSREDGESQKYVQDNIKMNGQALAELLFETQSVVYVCGDAKNMAKDVFESFTNILQQQKELTETEARHFMAQLQLDKRYLQDVWT